MAFLHTGRTAVYGLEFCSTRSVHGLLALFWLFMLKFGFGLSNLGYPEFGVPQRRTQRRATTAIKTVTCTATPAQYASSRSEDVTPRIATSFRRPAIRPKRGTTGRSTTRNDARRTLKCYGDIKQNQEDIRRSSRRNYHSHFTSENQHLHRKNGRTRGTTSPDSSR